MTGVRVVVPGLRQLARELRDIGPAERAQLKAVNQTVAALVASRAREKARGLGAQHARYADAIGPGGSYGKASVKIDGETYPGALGVEFGAGHGSPRQRSTGTYSGYNNLPAWRGNSGDAGYSVYPTIRENAPDIVATYTAMLDSLLDKVFPS